MQPKTWLVLGATLAGLAVVFGAFGAHFLPSYFAAAGIADVTKRLEWWETGVRYQMYHALGMLALGLIVQRRKAKALDAAGSCFFFGVILFSGMLYAMTFTGSKRLGMIVPIGGLLFIVGWVLMALTGNVEELTASSKESARQKLEQELTQGAASKSSSSKRTDEDEADNEDSTDDKPSKPK